MLTCLLLTVGNINAQKSEMRSLIVDFLTQKCEDCYNAYFDGKSKSVRISTLQEHEEYYNEDFNRRFVVTGFFFYKTYYNPKKYESAEFTAIIDFFGNNVQQITFKKDHLYECTRLYGEKRRAHEREQREKQRQMEEKRTQQAKVEEYKTMLNDLCVEKYSSMFSRREYVNNSIVFESMTQEGNYKIVHIKGKHQYKGRYGDLYKDMPFEAKIEDTGNGYKITFKKRSKADFFHSSDYWETGTATIPYKTKRRILYI